MSEDRICYFNCVSCRAGFHEMLNGSEGFEIQPNHFELKKGEVAPPRTGDFIDFKKCPDCDKLTLVKA